MFTKHGGVVKGKKVTSLRADARKLDQTTKVKFSSLVNIFIVCMEQISFHVIVINDHKMTNTHLLENMLLDDKVIVRSCGGMMIKSM